MKNLVLFFLLLYCIMTQGQSLIKGYLTLKNPHGDSNIVGKRYFDEIFGNVGTTAISRNPGLQNMSTNEQKNLTSQISASIQKVLELKLGLSNTSIKVTNLTGLEIIDCNDFSKINALSDNNDYVVSAVVVKEFQIQLTNSNDIIAQAKLDSLVAKNIFDANLTVENKNDIKTIKSGTDLVVAIKLMNIESKKSYDIPCKNCPIKVENNNFAAQYDESTKANINISFLDMDPLDTFTFRTSQLLSENQGCFFIDIIFTGLPNADNTSVDKKIIICPPCNNMTGSILPNCINYRPTADFFPQQERVLFSSVLNKREIVNYSMRVENIKTNYINAPLPNNNISNYRIGNITGDIYLSRRVFKYKIKG